MNINSQTENNFAKAGTQAGGLSFGLGQNGQNFQAAGGASFKDFISQNGATTVSEVDNVLKDLEVSGIFSLKGLKVDEQDAKFFLGLLDNNRISEAASANYIPNFDKVFQNFSADEIVKSSNVSKTLIDLISKTHSTNKPVRIDFDNDITVVLRVDRDGRVNAQFFPGDKVAEEYLKNNLQHLKNRFDEQSIPYKELSYRQHKDNEQNQEHQEQHKENKNE